MFVYSKKLFGFFLSIAILLPILIPAGLSAKTKVIIAPVRGETQYSGLIKGMRYILMSDLERGGNVEVVSVRDMTGLFDGGNPLPGDMKEISKKIYADVMILLDIKEDMEKFQLWVRGYELNNGFNIGSETLYGEYNSLKSFQNLLAEVVNKFLFVSLSTAQLNDLAKGHTDNRAAIQTYGAGYEMWGKGDYVDAAAKFSQARKIDSRFELASNYMYASGNIAVAREKDPVKAAMALELVGKVDDAYEKYSAILAKNPNEVGALVGQGRILMSRNKVGEATIKFERAKALAPDDADVRLEIAKAYIKTNNGKAAYAELSKARELGNDSFELHSGMAGLYSRMGDKGKAGREYFQAASILESDMDLNRAREYYTMANSAEKTVAGILKEAQMLIQQREYRLAVTVLTKAVFIDSGKDLLWSELGYAYYLSGQYDEAAEKLRKAYALNNNNYKANLYLGILLFKMKDDPKSAIPYFKSAMRILPEEKEAYRYLSEIYQNTQQLTEAINLINKLIQQKPSNHELYKELGDLYVKGEDFDRAIESYRKSTDLRGDYVPAWEGLAEIYKRQGRDKDVLAVIEKLYEIDSSNNLLTRGSFELLSGLTKPELIQLVKTYPKYYSMALIDKVWINNVSLVEVIDKGFTPDKLIPLLNPYKLDLSKVRDDLEVAVFSQYRIIRDRGMLGKFPRALDDKNEFEDDNTVALLGKEAHLDAIFGFKADSFKRSGVTGQVDINLVLVTAAETHRYVNRPVTVSYLSKDIFVLNPTAFFLYVVIAFVFGMPMFYLTFYKGWARGKGTLVVRINYDAKKESFLTLKLSTSEVQDKERLFEIVRDKRKYEKERFRRHLKQRGALVRHMVGQMTAFDRIPARLYYVYLFGTVEDTGVTKKTVGNYTLMQKVKLEKGQSKEILFQLEKEEAFVKVFVRKGEEELTGLALKIDGFEDVKYSKAGVGAFFDLKVGKYNLNVTADGKNYRKQIDITSLEDKNVYVDLTELEMEKEKDSNYASVAEQMLASGNMEGAAELYREHGETEKADRLYAEVYMKNGMEDKAAELYAKLKDYQKAMEVYEKLGEGAKSRIMRGMIHFEKSEYSSALECLRDSGDNRILSQIYEKLGKKEEMTETIAQQYLDSGQTIEAAQQFEKAGNFAQAAEIYENLKDYSKAGYMYVKDGNFAIAGEMFAKAGDKKRAAAAFEKAGQYDSAVMFYRELGEKNRVAALLEKLGKFVEAAAVYRELGLIDEAVKACQKVDSQSPEYPKSQVCLGLLFKKKGIEDLAMNAYETAYSADRKVMPKDALYDYAVILEKHSRFKNAVDVFEHLLQSDLNFKDTAQRLTAVKSKLAKEKEKAAAPMHAAVKGGPSQTASGSRYEIIEELGRGAMGVVYKARDTLLDRIVAYKTLPAMLKDDVAALESLLKEAKTVAQLSHPNIVTVFDIGQENGVYYITMEYVQGKTLAQVLQKIKKVNTENFLNIANPLCDVLSYAHKRHVVHRDIKPSNIILFPSKGVKLMDFGIAKILSKGGADKTMMRGTPYYMAPEQILGQPIDNRTDIYSLGVTFYEMLAGVLPFTEGDVMYAHVHVPPKPLSSVNPAVDPNVASVVMRCLAKDKEQRFATIDEVSGALKGITV